MLFMFIPLLALAVRLPVLGGGVMLMELLFAGFGGAMLNDEYTLLCGCEGGGAIEKFERLLDMLGVEEFAAQGFDGCVVELAALLQSMPLPVVLACTPYDGVEVGDIMLPIPIAGFACEEPYEELPIPGLLGAMAGNDELRLPKLVSGVIARL